MKKNITMVSSPQVGEYHSDQEQLRFVSMVITPLEDNDHDRSLFPILEEDGQLGDWTTEESEDLRRPSYSARRSGLDHNSEGSFTSLMAALSLKDRSKTFRSTDTMEIRSNDPFNSLDNN
jgi:hypothetical protein